MVVSFILPPTGEIDPTVLAGSGELFAWAALGAVIKGLDKGVDAKVRHGETEVEINNPINEN